MQARRRVSTSPEEGRRKKEEGRWNNEPGSSLRRRRCACRCLGCRRWPEGPLRPGHELNQLRDKYDYRWSEDYKDL
eukprot:785167-Rhodomonas_salina.1